MFDLHTHSIFSDGELVPSEIARRLSAVGNEGFAITDHADFSNISFVLSNLLKLREIEFEIEFLVGVEITHVPPRLIGKAVELAWKEGAEIVIVHGETISEPVAEGTNSNALDEEINILAHPGLISEKDAEKAKENGIFLEISARRGHCFANGHVARIAEKISCELVINTDMHTPADIINSETARKILLGAGIKSADKVLENNERLFRKLRNR
ncbi:MAG: histidinol phosphate phosphatase domain-containing protein [Archaeoglobaceae archaeon]|nr:histidinol phosphate phosphatase domain-containing protein [Archaeoglobaceae archaeon]MDW8128376.1 histidinol phosphate phosphatase domain-containing protein [Archaeoglobaceae archaeon]